MTKLLNNHSASNEQNTDIYDVVICGGGIAGMTLARQLKLQMPNISILVIDRLARPLPNAAFKVGESTVEAGSYYLAKTLQLTDYFQKNHLPKLGLRFFLGDPQDLFNKRPEIGIAKFHSPSSYQINRGLLENDLRQFNVENGIELQENCLIQDIALCEHTKKVERSDRQQLHTITYKQLDKKSTLKIKARWVVDAMGRRRFLQRKLGLAQPNNEKFSAAWFRINDRIDVSDFVPVTDENWHNRTPDKIRYYSTNHLVGKGYWIWLIPLSSGYTSIGIVTDEDVHAFEKYHTYEKAYKWLEKYEPVLAAKLKGQEPKDFRKMPKYSYLSSQVFSLNRWACVGEAGVFVDPLYSVGMDMIAFANSLTTEMIRLDLDSNLTEQMTEYANSIFLGINNQLASTIKVSYQILGKNSLIISLKFLWDSLIGWSISMPMTFNSLIIKPERISKLQSIMGNSFALAHRIEKLFLDWSNKSLDRLSFDYIDYLDMLPFAEQLRSRSLEENKTDQQLNEDYVASLEILEELAQVIFLFAVEDTTPEKLDHFPQDTWLNAWAISLNPDRWESDGLFNPKSKPRDLQRVMSPLRKHICCRSLAKVDSMSVV